MGLAIVDGGVVMVEMNDHLEPGKLKLTKDEDEDINEHPEVKKATLEITEKVARGEHKTRSGMITSHNNSQSGVAGRDEDD